MLLKVLLSILFIICFNLPSKSQSVNWVDSCTSFAYRGKIMQPMHMQNFLRGHFVLQNNDALLFATIDIPSPNLPGKTESRVLMQRVKSNGDSLWAKFIGFAPNIVDTTIYCHTVKQLKNGDIILVFTSLVYDNYGPIFVRIDNVTGNIIWVRQHNLFIGGAGTGFFMSSILEDSQGDLVCVGAMLFDGLVMKIKSTNGDMIFTMRYRNQDYCNLNKVVETESNYTLLGSSSDATYSIKLLAAIEKTNGMPLFGFGLDSTNTSPMNFENLLYENGVYKLQGNAFTFAINSPIISNYLTMDTNGTILSSKIVKSNVINHSYFPFSRGGAENFDYKNNVGVSSVTYGGENETHLYKLNSSIDSVLWSNVIPYPNFDIFAGLLIGNDNAFVLGGNNLDSVNGITAMLIKTLPNGKMGACPTVDFPVIVKDSMLNFKKVLLTPNYFFFLSELTPPIVSFNASGYKWEVTCNASQTCKLSKTIGKQIVCKMDTVIYSNQFTGYCSNKINYFIYGTGATIISTTDSSIQIVFNQTGTFKLLATMQANCGILKDSIIITSKIAIKPIISPIQSICRGDTATLTITPNTYNNFWWSTNAITSQIKVADTGIYSIIVKDVDGCFAYDTLHIKQLLEKPSQFLPNDTTICKYLPIYLNPANSYIQYLWNNGSSQIPLKVNKAGLYILQVKNANGCIGKDSIQILENGCKQWVRFPTAFTPNNDGQNDIWKAFTYGSVEQFSLQIYNRWGQIIYNSSSFLNGWNGNYKGTPVPQGTYIITCKYKLEDEPIQLYKGTIIVLR